MFSHESTKINRRFCLRKCQKRWTFFLFTLEATKVKHWCCLHKNQQKVDIGLVFTRVNKIQTQVMFAQESTKGKQRFNLLESQQSGDIGPVSTRVHKRRHVLFAQQSKNINITSVFSRVYKKVDINLVCTRVNKLQTQVLITQESRECRHRSCLQKIKKMQTQVLLVQVHK